MHSERREGLVRSFLRTGAVVLVALVGMVPLNTKVHAQQGDVTAAARAYSQAQAAELAGDHALAAEMYELANSIMPAPEALRSAVRQRLQLEHFSLAATHALELLRLYPDDAKSRRLAERVLDDTRDDLARLFVRCPSECRLSIDDVAAGTGFATEHEFFAEPGEHLLQAHFGRDGGVTERPLRAQAGERTMVSLRAPPPPPEPEETPGLGGADQEEEPSGLTPWVFYGAAVVTAGLAGVAVWSGVDTKQFHDDVYDPATGYSMETYNEGQDREKRTNILMGVAIGWAVVTAGLAVFFTDWSGDEDEEGEESDTGPRIDVAVTPKGGGLTISSEF